MTCLKCSERTMTLRMSALWSVGAAVEFSSRDVLLMQTGMSWGFL